MATVSRSARLAILLVAWRSSASGSSSAGMPAPSSSTTMLRTPPAVRRTVIDVAPASSALSTSSRTTEAGRSMTSPAAIWLIRVVGQRADVSAWVASVHVVRLRASGGLFAK